MVIVEIQKMDGYHDRTYGKIDHQGHMLDAVLFGDYDRLDELRNVDATAEYELNEIVATEVNLPKANELSGIYPKADDLTVVDGLVHSEIVIDDVVSVFDVYIQNGPDFISISTEDLSERPKMDTRIRIIGRGLHAYPTFT